MKKSKVLEKFKGAINFVRYKTVREALEKLERGETYLITKNGKSFPCMLTHFYSSGVRFKVLSNPSPHKANANYHSIPYLGLCSTNIEKISKKDIVKYMGTSTPHMAEALRKK